MRARKIELREDGYVRVTPWLSAAGDPRSSKTTRRTMIGFMVLILSLGVLLIGFALWIGTAQAQIYPSNPPLMQPFTPNAYGPGLNHDATGRPFYWQPQMPGALSMPDPTLQVNPHHYGFGQAADQYGRPVRPQMGVDGPDWTVNQAPRGSGYSSSGYDGRTPGSDYVSILAIATLPIWLPVALAVTDKPAVEVMKTAWHDDPVLTTLTVPLWGPGLAIYGVGWMLWQPVDWTLRATGLREKTPTWQDAPIIEPDSTIAPDERSWPVGPVSRYCTICRHEARPVTESGF